MGAVASHLPLEQVHLDAACSSRVTLRLQRPSPCQGIHPRGKLRERERLDEIIVGSSLETANPVLYAAKRGQQENRQFDVRGRAPAERRQAVHTRQHSVDDRDIELLG